MSEDNPEARPDSVDGAVAAKSRKRAVRTLQVGRWLLPPVLACAAVGIHFALNVPSEPVVAGDRDQGAKKAKKAKRRARAKRRNRHKPRSGPELDRLFDHYAETPFDKEPVVGKWARMTQTMLNHAVVMARKQAFDGAPEEPHVSVTRIQCRTIRCRFTLRSPFPHEIELLSASMQQLETGGQSIWRTYQAEDFEPPTPAAPKEDKYLQVTVTLIADDIAGNQLELDEPQPGPTPKE